MIQKHSHTTMKTSASDQRLAETRIVAQEVVYFLEMLYHTASFMMSLPTYLRSSPVTSRQQPLLLTQRIERLFETIYHTTTHLKTLLLFTAADLPTFAIPTILFGLCGALSGPVLTTNSTPSLLNTILRIPEALLLIWLNLLIFNISNQRTPSAVEEDRINKPHRPIPSGRITIEAARRLNLVLVPILLILSWTSAVWHETLFLLAMQWMYNDLRGCDESLFLRNTLIAVGYGLYSAIALSIMTGSAHSVSSVGYQWIGLIALVMLTTQHICDIKDAEGDRVRGRKSAPIVLGDAGCRWSVAVPIVICSAMCPALFGLGWVAYGLTMGVGGLVAGRTLFLRDLESDKMTWRLWALWTCTLFVLPLLTRFDGVVVDLGTLWEALMHFACPGHDCAEKLNVLAISGVALAVKGSGVVGRVGAGVERELATVPKVEVEFVA